MEWGNEVATWSYQVVSLGQGGFVVLLSLASRVPRGQASNQGYSQG